MTKGLYLKLAASNIKKNNKTYVPYILTCILTVAMYYIMKSLTLNPDLERLMGGQHVTLMLRFGSKIVGLFALIFLFYTNSFLIKRRKKEFGVFNILGMEKRHLAIVLGWETIYVLLIALAAGLGLGLAMDKMMFLLIAKLMNQKTPLGFFFTPKTALATAALFAGIFSLILIRCICQVQIANPIELLRAGNAGEREPKTRWLMALFGVLCVGSGYILAIITENPVTSIPVFFVAVILVIIGTYQLFAAASIAVLKMLRANKNFYYRTKHFTSVSGMIYRMKQNAAGLSNICILSTMVLVMLSATCSLLIGKEDILNTRYPFDFSIKNYETEPGRDGKVYEIIRNLQEERGMHVTNKTAYMSLEFLVIWDGTTFVLDRDALNLGMAELDEIYSLFFLTIDDYNRLQGEHRTLEPGQILLCSGQIDDDQTVLKLLGEEYQIAGNLEEFTGGEDIFGKDTLQRQFLIVVPDLESMQKICEKQKELYENESSRIKQYYGFDSDLTPEEQIKFFQDTVEAIKEQELDVWMDSKADSDEDLSQLYGGFFFIGIFLGVLFIMATVLIIYYKQISEGFDDKERFAIMQKVGMELREIRASIRSQVLMVFFLPLLVAGCHVAAAFPLISRILALMNFINTRLYVICTGVTFLAFAVMYVVIYAVTARVYYRIVSR